MVEWIKGFIIPLVEIIFIGGIVGWVLWIVGKAFYNAYTKSFKFFWKYKIMRKQYAESTLRWCLECMDKGIGWYEAKKLLMVKMVDKKIMNETLWIYDQILIKYGNGGNKYDRQNVRGNREDESKQTSLPNIS